MSRFRDTTTVIIAICLAAFVACKAQQKQPETQQPVSTGPKPTEEPTVYKGVTDQNCAAEMAFGSYGAGIDSDAFGKTMTLIGKFSVQYTSKNIGREGETRICMPLTELEKKNKEAFIDSLKIIAKGGQLVSVSIR
jgi:hypothetical protein